MSNVNLLSNSVHSTRRRGVTSGVSVNPLSTLRAASPARNVMTKRAVFEGMVGANAKVTENEIVDVGMAERNRSNSPIIGESGEITIDGEDEFNKVYNSTIEQFSRNNEKSEGYTNLVKAFSRSTEDNLNSLESVKTQDSQNLNHQLPNSSNAVGRVSVSRTVPDYVTIFSKPATTDHGKTTTESNDATVSQNHETRPKHRERPKRLQNRLERNVQKPNEVKHSTAAHNLVTYTPAYIQTVPQNSNRTFSAYETSKNQARQDGRVASTLTIPAGHLKNVRSSTHIQRIPARQSRNRPSSISSDSSNSEASTFSQNQGANSSNETTLQVNAFNREEHTSSRPTRRQRRIRNAQQRSNHASDYLNVTDRLGNVADPVTQSMRTPQFQDDNSSTYKNGENKESSFSSPVVSKRVHHRSRVKNRRHYYEEVDEKYATLPADFRTSAVTKNIQSSQSDVTNVQLQKPNVLNNNYVEDRLSRQNESMINHEQTSSGLDKVEKSYPVRQSRKYQSHNSEHLSQNRSNELNCSEDGIAVGRKLSTERSPTASSQTKSKPIGALRNVFNAEELPKTKFNRVFNNEQQQLIYKLEGRSSKLQVPNDNVTIDKEQEVHSQPMLKARKVSEHYWPPNEATEMLLNPNHVSSIPDAVRTDGLGIGSELPSNPTSSVQRSSQGSVTLDNADIQYSPKETNLNDPEDLLADEYSQSAVSTCSTCTVARQAQSLYVRDISPHTSTETLQASIRNGEMQESQAVERLERSRSLDGEQEPINSDRFLAPKWSFDDSDKKLKTIGQSMNKYQETDLHKSRTNPVSEFREQSAEQREMMVNEPALNEIASSLHSISINNSSLHVAPEFETSSPVMRNDISNTENKLLEYDEAVEKENEVESDGVISINGSKSIMSSGNNMTSTISTSTRKSSVVSQSTALPRKASMRGTLPSTESGDVGEDGYVEDPNSKVSKEDNPFVQANSVFENVDVSRTDLRDDNRRRRKYPITGQAGFSSSNNGSSSESSRSLSDPIPSRKKSLTGLGEESGSVDSNFQFPLRQEPITSESNESVVGNNSASDLSACSESAPVQGDFSSQVQPVKKSPDSLSNFDSKSSAKLIKKKAFSDPNAYAVLTAGLMGKSDGDVDMGTIYSSSSEPALPEQIDKLGDLKQFRDYQKTRSYSDSNAIRQKVETNDRSEGIKAMTQSIEEMSQKLLSADSHMITSPRSQRRGLSAKARKRGLTRSSTNVEDKIGLLKETEHMSLSSDPLSLEVKSDLHLENSLKQEEEQFKEIFDIMSTSNSDSSAIKTPVAHTRSCSAPAVGDDLDILPKFSKRGGRRAGIVEAPALNDVLLNKNKKSSNLTASKQLSSSVDRIPTTLPHNAADHRMDYGTYLPGRNKQDMRKHVVINLLETEDSYVKSLRILYESYFKPLKRPENHAICEPRLVDEMFFQIPEILQYHQKFYANIRDCFENWDSDNVKIGDVFMQSFNKDMLLESYTSYIKNYMNAREAVTVAIAAKSAFKVFLDQRQKENKDKQGLSDLMIQPVQRIPRYELIIKDLLKHTPEHHPDRPGLLIAQNEIHALSVQMNKGEKDAEAADRHSRLLQEIEQLIEGCMDIGGTSKRRFLHQDICMELKSNNRKDRSLWLFNDLLMCTSKKGRAATLRRSSMNLFSMTPDRVMVDFTSKYKFLWKFPLEDVDLLKGSIGPNHQTVEKQLQQLRSDQEFLRQIEEIANRMTCNHSELDEAINELVQFNNQRIIEKQQQSFHGITLPGRLEIGIATQEGMKLFQFEFTTEDSKSHFEHLFWEAKKNLTKESKWGPVFMKAIPISKTRNGMQFSCAAPNTDTSPGTREVWVCNTDGYVGQICFLTLEPEPQQTQCLTVCHAKICCIAQVPAWDRKLIPTSTLINEIWKTPLSSSSRRRSSSNSNPARHIISWDDTDESDEENTSPISTMGSFSASPYSTNNSTCNFDSSATTMGDSASGDAGSGKIQQASLMHALLGGGAYKKDSDGSTLHGSLEDFLNESSNTRDKTSTDGSKALGNNGSMWLGTEDGNIKVYSTAECFRSNFHCVELSHSASVQCILHHEGQVFVALSNGDLVIYFRDMKTGQWNFDKKCIPGNSSNNPITKMIVVNDKELWCGCQNQIIILDVKSHNIKSFFPVTQDNKRQIYCMVCCGYGVWVALDRKSHIKLYHSITHDQITEIDVSHPVNKMLASSDAIIRQHKAACLRITSLLVCKDLLWVGTSAGVVLTLALPTINASTNSLPLPIMPQGLAYGHTGHVRFLTSVEVLDKETAPTRSGRRPSAANRRLSSASASNQARMNTLIISGGDGYEDFRMNSASEVAGREDSTNHLLVWRV